MKERSERDLLGTGHLPLWFVKQFGLREKDLRGVKEGWDSPKKYVCVVRFDLKSQPD